MLKKIILYFSIGFFLLLLDVFVKYYVFNHIPIMNWVYPGYPFGGIGVFKFWKISFSINHVENSGAAWGILRQYSYLLVYLRIIIVLFLVGYMWFDKKNKFPLLLITVGAVGNILDFIFYGKVIDMFHFKFSQYSYPIFNFADVYITIGIILMLLMHFISKHRKEDAS